jgi:AcrR family transcriptional regulator
MSDTAGRPNQKMRTRKDLLQAAARLMKQGVKPTLEDIAEAALVSRATAYRYFPSMEALLLEASLDVATPNARDLFGDDESGDALARVLRVDTAMHDMVLAQEPVMRMFLANALERSVRPDVAGEETPTRQNRRSPLIEAALAPARDQMAPETYDTLSKALALIIGTEAMIACKDVLRLNDAESRKVKAWAIAALVDAAQKPVNKGK